MPRGWALLAEPWEEGKIKEGGQSQRSEDRPCRSVAATTHNHRKRPPAAQPGPARFGAFKAIA